MKTNDLKTYREMSQPFTPEAANAALNAFFAELYDLRIKHRIRDVYAIVAVPVSYPADEQGPEMEADAFSTLHCGSELQRLPMAQWAAGFESAKAIQMMNKARTMGENAKQSIGGRN